MVRITPAAVAPLALPSVSITADDSTAAEPGANTARFRVTRTGLTNAPLTVSYTTGGTAVNGADYNALSNFVVIPAGAFSNNITLTPRDDAAAEGTETVELSLFDTTGYRLGVVHRFSPAPVCGPKETYGAPRFPENPATPLPCSQIPAGPRRLASLRRSGVAPVNSTSKAPAINIVSPVFGSPDWKVR